MKLPTRTPQLNFKLPSLSGLSFPGGLGRSGGGEIVGLDIQPGFVAAVQARVNGSILAERAAWAPLAADTVRDGEVFDEDMLSETLKEMFASSGLGKRVRVGVANQRTVLRTLELPPVTDEKELAAAVAFQAQDQVPMPLNNAVLDFHPLGIVDTPSGPRQRVVLVAAQRDMIERLLSAVRRAGLTPAGVDLSAFALIRSLYTPDDGAEQSARVLYLNVDGLTNLAIAEGKVCRFTRVVGSGLEGMALELAGRRGIALTEARALFAEVDLGQPIPAAAELAAPDTSDAHMTNADVEEPDHSIEVNFAADAEPAREHAPQPAEPFAAEPTAEPPLPAPAGETESYYDYAAELGHGFESDVQESEQEAPAAPAGTDLEVRSVLENGIRDISGEVRNSLDFHRSQDGGGEVSHVVLSGAAEGIPGFAEALQQALGVEVRAQSVGLTDAGLAATVSQHRLAVAAGLATTEAPQ